MDFAMKRNEYALADFLDNADMVESDGCEMSKYVESFEKLLN